MSTSCHKWSQCIGIYFCRIMLTLGDSIISKIMTDHENISVKKQLMLVEDDKELANLINDFLSRYEFEVTVIDNGIEAAKRIVLDKPDIVILDVMLPGQSGMEVCKQVRSTYDGFILMQTALDDDIDQMMGLELGADDYVIKQVQPRLLLSRIRALLRRAPHGAEVQTPDKYPDLDTIVVGSLVINIARRKIVLDDKEIELTTAEFELLYLLARNSGKLVSRDDIMRHIRGYDYDGLDRSIDRRISRLRKRLQGDSVQAELIKTIRGQGYQLCM